MKPVRSKSIRMGAFHKWRYAGSLAGISFFACPKSKGTERMLLSSQLILIVELGNLRFSLPSEAILTMEIFKKQEIQRTGFQSQNILVEHTIMHSYSIAQNAIPAKVETPAPKQETHKEEQEKQKLTDHVLKLKDYLFKEIAERITPLPADATPQQRIAKLHELFDLLKKDGELGILYEASEGRMPKTPNDVLTPEKDKTRKADCDEFSLLFVAAAKRLNIDVSDISIGVMKFETGNGKGDKKEALHAAALMVGGDKYLVDPVFGFFQKVSSFEIKEIQPLYKEKPIDADFTIVGILELKIAGTPEQMAAIHYREMAKYYEDKSEPKFGAAKDAELTLMETEVQKGLLLYPENSSLKELRYELAHTYLDIADKHLIIGETQHAMDYVRKASQLYENESTLNENERIELCHAFNTIGEALHAENNNISAIKYFEKAMNVKPDEAVLYRNKISALLYLSDKYFARDRETSKSYFLEARKTAEESRAKVPDAEEKLKDVFPELDRLGQRTGW